MNVSKNTQKILMGVAAYEVLAYLWNNNIIPGSQTSQFTFPLDLLSYVLPQPSIGAPKTGAYLKP